MADEELPSREQLTGCHLLFVSVSERDRVPLILERLERASVMTVSDVEDFAASGGWRSSSWWNRTSGFDSTGR